MKHLAPAIFIFFLFSTTCSRAMNSDCFSPEDQPALKKLLKPNDKFHETPETIQAIHDLIYKYRKDIDPRLVYYRMIGESMVNPYAVNPSSGAYGMFQFLGKPYKGKHSYREILEAKYRERPGVSPRLIQVEYYLMEYVQAAKAAANQGYGCKKSKTFSQYSDLEKSAYLGWGACNSATLETELGLCSNVSSYKNGGCSFTSPLYRGNAPPLCDRSGSKIEYSPFVPPVVADSLVDLEVASPASDPIERAEVVSPAFNAEALSQYFEGNPKYLRLNEGFYNVRSSPDFSTKNRDNIVGSASNGEIFEISSIMPKDGLLAVEILRGNKREWIAVPANRKSDFRFCNDPACLDSVTEFLNLLSTKGLGPEVLKTCGLAIDYQGNLVETTAEGEVIQPEIGSSQEPDTVDKSSNTDVKPKRDCVSDTRKVPRPDFRNYPKGSERKQAFIRYLAPFALDLQEKTGLPASVLIAQSALESGWGASENFQESKNLIGHICLDEGEVREYLLPTEKGTYRALGRCEKRGANSYREFESAQDSIYAYAVNLLHANHSYYSKLQKAIDQARPGIASYQDVLSEMDSYGSAGSKYLETVSSIIKGNNLDEIDAQTLCQ